MKRRHLIGALGAAAAAPTVWGQAKSTTAWNIGRSLPLTGLQSAYGEAKRDGAEAFAAAVNARGGIAGRRIVFHTVDDGYDEKRVVANIAQISEEHDPVAFTGFFGAPQSVAAAAKLVELGIPGVGFTTGSNVFREKPQREIFPVRSSFVQETAGIVKHLKTIGIDKAVIAYVDIPFGHLARSSYEKAAAAEGLTLGKAIDIRPDGSNMRQAATAAQANGTLVLLALHTPGAVGFVKELRAIGSSLPTWCLSAVDTSILQQQLRDATRGVASSVVVPSIDKLRVPVVREYLAATKAIDKRATTYGLEAYIEMKVLAQGLARAKGTGPKDLIAGLETIRRFDVGGLEIDYGANDRTGARFVDLVMVTNSSVVS